MITKVVSINRVSKTVKGGRVMKFAALIVVGDGKGNIGYGVGKSGEVPEAIRKGEGAAKKNMRKVCLKGTTIPHEIVGEYGAGRVLMRPAAPGTGVLAGGPVRAVLECAGIKDIRAKVIGSEMVIRLGILDAKLLLNAIGNLMPKTEETDVPKEAEKEASPKETEKEASSKETKEVKKEEVVKKETSKEDVMRIKIGRAHV